MMNDIYVVHFEFTPNEMCGAIAVAVMLLFSNFMVAAIISATALADKVQDKHIPIVVLVFYFLWPIYLLTVPFVWLGKLLYWLHK